MFLRISLQTNRPSQLPWSNLHKTFFFLEPVWILRDQVCLDMQVSRLEGFVSETVKALVECIDSEWACSLRIICCLDSRIRSLSGFMCEVLQERNLFMIFRRKIDQWSWRDFNSSWSTKFEGISLKILVIRIQVIVTIKRGSLFLFKSIVLVFTLFEIY